MSVQNIEMNIKNDLGTYDILYPQTICQNIIDLIDNYYSKNQIVQESTLEQYGLSTSSLPDDLFSTIKTLIQTAQNTANEAPKIQVGSYTGTGTYGSGNENKIRFSISPSFVVVIPRDLYQGGYMFLFKNTKQTVYMDGFDMGHIQVTWSGNTVRWKSIGADGPLGTSYPSAGNQGNYSGKIYDYIGIG